MKTSDIALFLRTKFIGNDIEIKCFATLADIKPDSIIFVKKFTLECLKKLNQIPVNYVAIVTDDFKDKLKCSYILSADPRLDFIRVLNRFFGGENSFNGIHQTAIVETSAALGSDVFIGANCYIGNHVIIGDRTKIFPNVVIMDDTVVGSDCYIKSGAVIGQPDFGFEKDENGIPIHFPHLGKVIIGNDVYIGANTAINRATLDSTIIEDNVKIDDLVQVSHNSKVESCSYVIAGTILCGGVHIGKNCWIAPNVSIKQQLTVGDNVVIGLGSVVIRDVEHDTVVAGNPCKEIKRK